MSKRGLFFLIGGLFLMVIMQIAVRDDQLPDFASGLIGGTGIGLLIVSLLILVKDRRTSKR